MIGGKEIKKCEGHTGRVNGIAFANDGKHIATASNDKTARIWEVSSGKEIKKCEGHTGTVIGIAFDNDGQHIATASSDKTARF